MHLQKFGTADVQRIFDEQERKAKAYKNNVDLVKSHLNKYDYNGYGSLKESFEAQMNGVFLYAKNSTKRETKPLGSFIVTTPADVKEEDREKFQEIVIEYFDSRYRDIKVGVCCHNDETTPHLHYTIVPKVWDRKHNRWKISSHVLFPRSVLENMHKDLSNYVEKNLGYKVSILKLDGVKRDLELKEFQAKADSEKAIKRMQTAEAVADERTARAKELSDSDEFFRKWGTKENKKAIKEKYGGKVKVVTRFGKKYVQIPVDMMNDLVNHNYVNEFKSRYKDYRIATEDYLYRVDGRELRDSQKKNSELEKENRQLKSRNDYLERNKDRAEEQVDNVMKKVNRCLSQIEPAEAAKFVEFWQKINENQNSR